MKTFREWAGEQKSEDDSSREFAEKLLVKAKLDFDHDIPFLAGYNKEGTIFYIDRHVPPVWSHTDQEYPLHQFLLRHESVEKAAELLFNFKYESSHHLATQAEKDMVEKAGLKWSAYQAHCMQFVKYTLHEKLVKLPADLDMLPYKTFKDESSRRLVRKMEELMGKK